jgi:hypothetical protein
MNKCLAQNNKFRAVSNGGISYGAACLRRPTPWTELQLIIWEETLKRFNNIEVVGEPKRVYSNFVNGYKTLPARIAG